MKILNLVPAGFLLLLLSGCGGGISTAQNSSSAGKVVSSPEIASKVTLSGTIDGQATGQLSASLYPVAGATVHIVDSSGVEVATVTTDASGRYTAQVSKLTTYVVTVDLPPAKPSAASSTRMSSVVTVLTANATANVTPASTAVAIVLQNILNVPLGQVGVNVSATVNAVNIPATTTAISAAPGFSTLAQAVKVDVESLKDPFTDPALNDGAQSVGNAVTAVPNTGGNAISVATAESGAKTGTTSGNDVGTSTVTSSDTGTSTETGTGTSSDAGVGR